MLIILNISAILKQKISSYPRLIDASKVALQNYELTVGRTGVIWPALDEDLSLKGFLRDGLRELVKTSEELSTM